MRRLGAMLAATVPAALFSLASVSLAQEPAKTSISDESVFVQGGTEPDGFGPGAEPPAGPAQICAPRNDLYTNYSEAFMNPNAACAPTNTAGAMGQFLRGPRYYKWIFSYDQVLYTRSNPGNKVLVTTSPDIFDQVPGSVGPLLNGDPEGAPLYGPIVDTFSGTPLTINGVAVSVETNTPGVGQVFLPGENPNVNFYQTFNNPLRPTPVLVANQMMMETDQFDFTNIWGYRPKIGIEFQDESRVTFSFFFSNKFRPSNLVLDVSGSSFLTTVISTSQDDPAIVEWQRFGYLNSPFVTANPLFGGERARQVGDSPSTSPYNPANESPPIVGVGTSSDAPREPTLNDASRNGDTGQETQIAPSLLWRDGEVAIAQYTSQLIGSELLFEKSLFEWFSSPWKIWALGGVRYVGLNDSLVFTFADIAPNGSIGSTGYQAFSPFDRAIANNPGLNPGDPGYDDFAQPSIQTVAITSFKTYNNIVAPELGIRCVRPFCMDLFEFDLAGKGFWGGNWATRKASLVRGDGLVGIDQKTNSFATSGAFECQLGLNFVPHPNIRIRGGWEAMYLMGIASATGNVNFNLDQVNRPNFHDQVLFTGWYFGGEVTY